MSVRLELAPGLVLELDDEALRRLIAQLTTEEKTGDRDLEYLPPEHPMWDHASGGDRHSKREFGVGDEDEARALRRGLSPKAKVFFEELLTKPGHLFPSTDFIEKFPETFESPSAIAGCLNGFTKHCERADRSYPFYWWESDRGPTRYAIHPDVARVFIKVGP